MLIGYKAISNSKNDELHDDDDDELSINLKDDKLNINSELHENSNLSIDNVIESDNVKITILNINNPTIIYPNEKIHKVAPIIEEIIEKRDRLGISDCILCCQNCIRMFLDIATGIYIYLEAFIKWASMILVIIDCFNITKKRIKINGRSKFNYFTIENSDTERFRRIVYWYYYNNITPDEDEWCKTLNIFNLLKVPKFSIRLYLNGQKSRYSIEMEELTLTTTIEGELKKGTRIIHLYEDIFSTTVNGDIFIECGKKLLKTTNGTIPIGGLLPEKMITDVNLHKIMNKVE